MEDPVFLRRSDDGRISVFDERDRFLASFADGKWVRGLIFQDYELDGFTVIEDQAEIFRVSREARAALVVPSQQCN